TLIAATARLTPTTAPAIIQPHQPIRLSHPGTGPVPGARPTPVTSGHTRLTLAEHGAATVMRAPPTCRRSSDVPVAHPTHLPGLGAGPTPHRPKLPRRPKLSRPHTVAVGAPIPRHPRRVKRKARG